MFRAAACLASILLAAASSTVRAETLADAISLAYQTNPSILAQRASLRALNENYAQARAQYGPTFSASAQGSYADARVDQQSIFGGTTGQHQVGRTLSGTLSIVQPIYTGGQVLATVHAAEADILAGRENLRGASIQLLQNVILSYIAVRQDQEGVKVANGSLATLVREFNDTQARFKAREVTQTDLAQAQLRLSAARTQLSTAQTHLGVSRTQYAQFVGQNPGDLAPEPNLPGLPGTAEEAFDVAEARNPALMAAKFTEHASRERVTQARAAYGPNVSLHFDYGAQPLANYDQDLYDKSFTAQAVVSKPLFDAGANASRVRQAMEQNNHDRLLIDDARRTMVQNVSQAWLQLLNARQTLGFDEEQLRAAQTAYAGMREEERIGLRSTIDVLNAEQEMQNAELVLLQARHDAYAAQTALLGSMGLLSAHAIVPEIADYDPAPDFRSIAHKGGVPWESLVQKVDGVLAPRTPGGDALSSPVRAARPDLAPLPPSPDRDSATPHQ